jgi:hypothetical protein
VVVVMMVKCAGRSVVEVEVGVWGER